MHAVGKTTADVHVVNPGFNTPALIADKKVDAGDGLFNSERVTLETLIHGTPTFVKYADYGVPHQPVSQLVTNESFAASNRDLVERFIYASMRSIKRYLTDPVIRRMALTSCCTTGATASGSISLQEAKFNAGIQFWPPPGETIQTMKFGYQDLSALDPVLKWAVQYGLATKTEGVGAYFTNKYLTAAAENPPV